MGKFNPFPDYPVVLLKAEETVVSQQTVETDAIRMVRDEIIGGYAKQWVKRKEERTRGLPLADQQQIDPISVAVRGDYGSGKTHLLLYASAQLSSLLKSDYRDMTIIRVPCLQTDPLNWFKLTIGPELRPPDPRTDPDAKPGFVERVTLRMYAQAGIVVAEKTKMTGKAVLKLHDEPDSIRGLIKADLLSRSAVEEEFNKLLEELVPKTSETLRRAVCASAWGDTVALRWLAGEKLTELERSQLRLTEEFSDENEALQLLVLLAGMHRRSEIPFIFMIDELEQLTRYDEFNPKSRGNLNWLKKLLEGLADQKSLVFVSGHWSAWETEKGTPDYTQRFTNWRPIELVKLTAQDVLDILKLRVAYVVPFGLPEAKAVAEVSNGNIRRALSLCRALFTESNGFQVQVTPEKIEQIAIQLGQRITRKDAAIRLHEVLEREGLTVRADAQTPTGVHFDLIGLQGNQVKIVIDLKHAIHQTDQYDQVKVFIDRVEEVHKAAPDLVACFVADGNVDDKLLEMLNASRPFKLLWYDLKQTDVLKRITEDVRASLKVSTPFPVMESSAAQLDALKNQNQELLVELERRIKDASADTNAKLIRQLEEQRQIVARQRDELDRQIAKRDANLREEFLANLRAQIEESDRKLALQMEQLNVRLEAQRREAQSKRQEELLRKQEGEDAPKLSATYAEVTRAPSFSRKLRLALSGSALLIIFSCLVTGITLVILSDVLSESLGSSRKGYVISRIAFSVIGLGLALAGVLLAWLRLSKVEAFFDFSSRMLRRVYVGRQSVEDLILADNVLRRSLERYGPVRGKYVAQKELDSEMGYE
jgi:hypothetical protein